MPTNRDLLLIHGHTIDLKAQEKEPQVVLVRSEGEGGTQSKFGRQRIRLASCLEHECHSYLQRFTPIEQATDALPGEIHLVFSEEELSEVTEDLQWLKAADTKLRILGQRK